MTDSRRKLLYLAALLLPVLFLAGWSACLSWRHNHAHIYEVVVGGYDPRDMVYGKYVSFRFDWENPESQKPEDGELSALPVNGRYYVPEDDAADLEAMLRDTATNRFKASVAVFGNGAHIRNITVNGIPWQDSLAAWRKTNKNLGE